MEEFYGMEQYHGPDIWLSNPALAPKGDEGL